MANYRQARINEMMTRELSEIIRNVKDYRVSGSYITITGAECAADLKNARVYFSVMGGDPKEVRKGLISAHGFIRTSLAQRMNLRETPALTFIYDDSMERGARLSGVFKEIEKQLEEADKRDANGENNDK